MESHFINDLGLDSLDHVEVSRNKVITVMGAGIVKIEYDNFYQETPSYSYAAFR